MSKPDRPEQAQGLAREFRDEDGEVWIAGVRARPGKDFKGRFLFVVHPKDEGLSKEVWLEEVRWNSEDTARRTLRTMSAVELRRRLRAARGRCVAKR